MIPSSLRDSFSFVKKIQVSYTLQKKIQHGQDLETLYLEDGRHLGASEADTEVGVL